MSKIIFRKDSNLDFPHPHLFQINSEGGCTNQLHYKRSFNLDRQQALHEIKCAYKRLNVMILL